MSDRLRGYSLVCTYWYMYPDREVLFGKHRFELLEPISGVRSKTFRYFDPATGTASKPRGADALLYRLPDVALAIETGQTVHWTEGEKDADALWQTGLAATSHHQGAGRVTVEQAEWLVGARRVVVWADRDLEHPEIGAYDACLRFNRLVEAGLPASRVRVVTARRGKDAYDHLAAGLRPSEARVVDLDRLVSVARRYTPSSGRMGGYSYGH